MQKSFFIFMVIVTISCSGNPKGSREVPTVSNNVVLPRPHVDDYFPYKAFIDTPDISLEDARFKNRLFSTTLHLAKEPILCGNYIGVDVYQLLWCPSFEPPSVISFYHKADQVWLTARQLDIIPNFDTIHLGRDNGAESVEPIAEPIVIPAVTDVNTPLPGYDTIIQDGHTVLMGNRRAKVAYTVTRNLSINEWRIFKEVFDGSGFWELPQSAGAGGPDGDFAVFEAHTQKSYRYVETNRLEVGLRRVKDSLLKWGNVKYQVK